MACISCIQDNLDSNFKMNVILIAIAAFLFFSFILNRSILLDPNIVRSTDRLATEGIANDAEWRNAVDRRRAFRCSNYSPLRR